VAAQHILQVAKTTKTGGKNIQKNAVLVGSQPKETGHTVTTCPTHCLPT
jgi:hypothetical protein